jgi:hypothetical protein
MLKSNAPVADEPLIPKARPAAWGAMAVATVGTVTVVSSQVKQSIRTVATACQCLHALCGDPHSNYI